MSNVAEEQLKFENAFQQVLITLATRFINIPVDQMDQAITEALRQIVEFLGGMRASVNEISEDRTHFTARYQWSSIDEARSFPAIAPIPEAPVTIPMLERDEVVVVNDVNSLPQDSDLRRFLASFKIASLAVVPIFRQQTLIGFVATSWIAPRVIQKEIIDLLHVVAEIFLNAQDRRDNETRIHKLNEELEKRVGERTSDLRAANERLQSEIAERQQVEEALRISEERYRVTTELISDYAFLCRVEANGAVNLDWITEDPFERLTGYPDPREAYQLYHPEDRGRVEEDVARTLQGNATDGEYRIITRSGEIRWLYFRRFPLWDEQHAHVDHFYGVAQDITSRKQTEEALRISEERYRIISEVISDYAFLYQVEADGSLKLEWITRESYTRLIGYTPEETIREDDPYSREYHEISRQDVQRTLRGESVDREYRTITKSGEERWIYMRRFPIWDEQHERVVRFYGVAQDITQRKQAEEALRQNEERYRIISEVISDYAFLYQVEADRSIKLEWLTRESYTRVTGYTPEEAPITDRRFSPEFDVQAREDVERTLRGEIVDREYRAITKSGDSRWIYMRRYPVWDAEQGRVVRFYGVAQDITERKKIEEALRQSEERYRIVNQLISDYAFVYRIEADGTMVHEWITADSYLRLTGYTHGEGNNTYHLYHPDDAALADQDVQATIRGETTEREYRIITKAGEMRWIYMHRYPIWDEQQGRVVRFYGVAQDITERKRIEAEEREQRALAEALLDTVDALNSTLDLDEVLDRILANIDRVVPHNEGAIMLIESDVARIVRAKGSTINRNEMEALRFPIAETPNLRQVHESRQPLVIPDVKAYPGWVEVSDFGIRCHVCIPIEQDDQMIGFLTWDSKTPNSFNPKALIGLQAFAHQTAVAITNAKLYQQGQAFAILEERQRLARDLHDAVTQTLFSASMIAEMLLRQWDHNPEQVRQGLGQLHLLTRGALAEMRSLLIELRPEALDGVGLPRLISQLAEAFSGRTGIVPTVTIEGERTLPQEVKIALYRIAQEALNNVSKHARASEVFVKLSMDRMVELTLWDNGRGFLPEQLRSDSFGLKIMRERAELVGARLTIASEPGKQTTLKVE
ncbi:MAG: PAS domain-containing protein, partial [Chloroflexota bacterium]